MGIQRRGQTVQKQTLQKTMILCLSGWFGVNQRFDPDSLDSRIDWNSAIGLAESFLQNSQEIHSYYRYNPPLSGLVDSWTFSRWLWANGLSISPDLTGGHFFLFLQLSSSCPAEWKPINESMHSVTARLCHIRLAPWIDLRCWDRKAFRYCLCWCFAWAGIAAADLSETRKP